MFSVSMITLGVENIARSTDFYEKIGLKRSSASQESVTFFQTGGSVLGLYGLDALAEDGNAQDLWSGKGGFALAFNVGSEQAVDDFLAHAQESGARIIKPAQKAFWGGYHGYFADLDDHIWEVAYNPYAELDENGVMKLP